jgi:lipoprotein-releasing system permease protein
LGEVSRQAARIGRYAARSFPTGGSATSAPMGFPFDLALRYMRSKKRSFVSVGTMFAVLGVALGVAALATVISVTGGFRKQFRDKVLGVNAHVLVLKYTSDFREYRKIMDEVRHVPGVIGVAPFVINPMMVTHGDRTATGVLLKGVDPDLMGTVLDLPRHIVEGDLKGLRRPGAAAPAPGGSPGSRSQTNADRAPPANDAGAPPADDALPKQPLFDVLRNAADAGTSKSFKADSLDKVLQGKQTPTVRASADAEEIVDAGSAGTQFEVPPGAPVGSIVPDGGYTTPLPEDDPLPEELDPNPCKSREAALRLPGTVLGITLAHNLRAKIGDCVQVTSPTIGFSYIGGSIRAPMAKEFRVTAVFDAGFDQYDSKLVYTDLAEAQAFYDSGDTVTGVEMKVNDIDRARQIGQEIDRRLGNGIYRIMDWEELNHGLFTALRIQQILMSLVLALIIVVAAFTVVATLIMVVLEKKKEIAVLKAMGATDTSLLRAFLYQGAIIGLVGTGIGLVLGLAVCKGLLIYGFPLDPKVYFISRLPVEVRPEQFLMVGVFAVLVCLVACAWPAFYAARLRPAEGFREQQ